jgi:serine/threonine-protein kinase
MLSKRKDDRPQDLNEPAAHFATLYRALHPAREAEAFAVLSKNRFRFQGCELTFRAGNIADETTAGIVTSSRYDMSMRSGVGDALRRLGGDSIEKEAMKDGERALGECIATRAGSLHTKWVLHAVSAWDETSCVGRAMMRALSVADSLGTPSLAFPALGTGAARVSLETCANAMATALRWRLSMGGSRLAHVSFVLADESKLAAFRDVAIEALRGSDTLAAPVDLGLSDDKGAVTADAATCLDTSGSATGT